MTAAETTSGAEPLLRVEDLSVEFQSKFGTVRAVDGISYEVYPGETLAVVGESGCGKSVAALSVLGLVPSPPGIVSGGEIRFAGEDLRGADPARLRAIRGNDIAMIFQEPMTSLNPVFPVGRQIAEALVEHRGLSLKRAFNFMRRVQGVYSWSEVSPSNRP